MNRSFLSFFKKAALGLALISLGAGNTLRADTLNGMDNFYKSSKVIQEKVTFQNQYKMKVTGNLFIPKNMKRNTKNPAIIIAIEIAMVFL